MPRIQTFDRDLRLATAGIAPENVAKALAAFARTELSSAIQSGEGSDRYEKYVNGRFGAEEETVVPPGPILYVFHWWNEILEFALQSAVERSPNKSGEYRQSWFVMVNSGRVADFGQIPINSTVILSNDRPYARKIDVGHMKMSVPPGVLEDVRKKVLSRFGNLVNCKRTLITLPNGYVLKGHFRRGIRQFARRKLQKDTQAGAQLTYPSLVFSMKAG